ncbi:hypothetical protein CDAR_272271 [Caerostris darwini]|uniref:Uncharacterized protein n=1 Tax=Caerostris darwini TaxID=1538125 RepID=A0AAV4UZV8_9ARAC|nr:hypothetical protein CDAR_272271 [Caerostris darwini]
MLLSEESCGISSNNLDLVTHPLLLSESYSKVSEANYRSKLRYQMEYYCAQKNLVECCLTTFMLLQESYSKVSEAN